MEGGLTWTPGTGMVMVAIGSGPFLAEAVRFELTKPFGLPVFKTGAIDHSATLPGDLF